MLKKIRIIMWLLVLVIGGVLITYHYTNDLKSTASTGIGGEFEMTDTAGAPFTHLDLKGKSTALFFGFTNCPTQCPVTMYELANATKDLSQQEKERLKIVFVSVDHERDTPEFLRDYLSAFQWDLQVIGLTGTADQISKIARAYRVFYEKTGDDDTFIYNHTASTFLLDADGVFQGTLSYGETPSIVIEKLKNLVADGA